MTSRDGEFVDRCNDILKNLSRYVTTCRICGKHHVDWINEERKEAWLRCDCGHIIHVFDRNVWH